MRDRPQKKIKLEKLSYRFYEVRGNFFKNINEYKKLVCIDFVTFLGLGTPTWDVFFGENFTNYSFKTQIYNFSQ